MLIDEIREIKSGPKELRQFGWVIAIACAALGGILYWKNGQAPPALMVLATFFLVPALVDSLFQTKTALILLPVQKIWMAIAVVIGFFVSRLILSVLYYLVFSGVHLVSKLTGSDLLDLTMQKSQDSYWIRRDPKAFDRERCEKQY